MSGQFVPCAQLGVVTNARGRTGPPYAAFVACARSSKKENITTYKIEKEKPARTRNNVTNTIISQRYQNWLPRIRRNTAIANGWRQLEPEMTSMPHIYIYIYIYIYNNNNNNNKISLI